MHYGAATAQAVMTRIWTGRPTNHSSIPGRSKGFFSSPERTRPPRRSTKPPTQQMPRVLSPGVKRQSAEVKNEWSYASNRHMLLWRAQHSFASFRNFIYVLIQCTDEQIMQSQCFFSRIGFFESQCFFLSQWFFESRCFLESQTFSLLLFIFTFISLLPLYKYLFKLFKGTIL